MSHATVDFTGIISSTTPDGGSAIVHLDKAVDGKEYAVISPDTQGRVAVLNGVGRLQPQTIVAGRAEVGPEALRVISVTSSK